ncbi:uncharacterized protein SAPINGB_P002355 [Magnusiomyces paraingens]|uniref:Chaps-domain-containing protein n=1 Tax=Magnusiomyces paraingens TaxID=2606893 RepID=A0A5E8BFK6_9ASCO|nr:uncharacterized protein SAPINGB_P002355 [Saprochaete ingens]VVT49611.1 unnamed protein product [Saprochaete ingens]
MVLSTPAVPELLETEVGESVNARTAALQTFKELGPPDLVHLSKTTQKAGAKVSGTYHYVTGVDASSSSAVAAYFNGLTFSLGEEQVWFGRHAGWKIHTGIYCAYNAFSRVDVRVLVKIPGGVEAYVVDSQGDKHPASEDQWTETYLSAMIRALLFTDDEAYSFISYWCRLNPFDGVPPKVAARFIDAFESLFFKGPTLGCVAEVQAPTLTNNYLVDSLYKFVKITGLYEPALKALERLAKIDSDVQAVLARTQILANEEVRAVETLHFGIRVSPRDYNLLQLQAEYCLKKGRLDWALDCSVRAVNAAPSEFLPWAQLVQIYTKMGDYEQALLTLNSCPMSTAREQDLPKMPPPAKAHFPLPTDGVLEEIWNTTESDEQNAADPGLLKLPAPTLRSTFAKAYELLTGIASKIGWDALLKYRSNVFIMEEEYRKDRKIKHERRVSNASKLTNGEAPPPQAPAASSDKLSPDGSEKNETKEEEDDDDEANKMKSKRLCERWLDNLFMVLYEDLRVYTVWRAEYVHYKSQQLAYRKTALEWELLGMVALRLRHHAEAADAFQQSLAVKFSHRVLWKLLDYYETLDSGITGPTTNAATSNLPHHQSVAQFREAYLDTIVRLTAWNHRWYIDFSPRLVVALRRAIADDGAIRVSSIVEANYKPQGVEDLIERDVKILRLYGALGTDA